MGCSRMFRSVAARGRVLVLNLLLLLHRVRTSLSLKP